MTKETTTQSLTVITNTLKSERMETELRAALPKNMSIEKFVKTAQTAILTHAQREKLADADRQSLYNACTKAAADGLVLDGREAALVVFGDQVQYMPMVQGLCKLARNTGEVADIGGYIVYENDKENFSFKPGQDKMPNHDPDWFSDRGAPVGVWAYVKLNSGDVIVKILTKEKIMRIASRSKVQVNYDPAPGKGKDWDEFWLKAAIRNVLKYAPKTTELESAMSQVPDEEEQEFVDAVTGEVTTVKKGGRRTTKAAAQVKAAVAESSTAAEKPSDDKTIEVTAERKEEPQKTTYRRSDNEPAGNEEEIPL